MKIASTSGSPIAAQQLVLGPLAAVEQDPLAARAQQDRGQAAARRWARSRRCRRRRSTGPWADREASATQIRHRAWCERVLFRDRRRFDPPGCVREDKQGLPGSYVTPTPRAAAACDLWRRADARGDQRARAGRGADARLPRRLLARAPDRSRARRSGSRRVLAGGEGAVLSRLATRRAVAGVAATARRSRSSSLATADLPACSARCAEPRPARRHRAPRHPGHDGRADARRPHRHADRRGADELHPRGRVPAAVLAFPRRARRWRAPTAAASSRGSTRRSSCGSPGAPGSRAGSNARSCDS